MKNVLDFLSRWYVWATLVIALVVATGILTLDEVREFIVTILREVNIK